MAISFYDQPILNSPYLAPSRHHALAKDGQPLDQPPVEGRRRSELISPVPKVRKRGAQQASLVMHDEQDLSTADQEYNPTPIINGIRSHVESWRALPNPRDWGVTPATARLLQHWRTHEFQGVRPFFCQIEAVETCVWLTEVARGQKRHATIWNHVRDANAQANPDLLRIALKMATGSGKTTVMAMLIAWQAVNAVRTPDSPLYSRGFLIVTPGITIKDRLRVLQTNDPDSYFRPERELVPVDMLPDIGRAKIVVCNYHAFKRRDTSEMSKVGRSLIQGRDAPRNTLETEGQMLDRAVKELVGIKGVVVINDEAHHCYREKPGEPETLTGEDRAEAKKNAEAARLWISGLEAAKRKLGVTMVYDLSATPFFLRGSGYAEGTLFPWTVSDFSLMDAIERNRETASNPGVGQRVELRDASVSQPLGTRWQGDAQGWRRQGRARRSAINPEQAANRPVRTLRPLRKNLRRVGQGGCSYPARVHRRLQQYVHLATGLRVGIGVRAQRHRWRAKPIRERQT